MDDLINYHGGWHSWAYVRHDWSRYDSKSGFSSPLEIRLPPKPFDTTKLKENEISLITKRASGYVDVNKEKNCFVMNMIRKRELGLGLGYHHSEECKINNFYLPNNMATVAHYNSKAFCSLYSADGKLLVTASQDNLLHLYNTENGEFHEIKEIEAQNSSWSILDVAYSPDGKYVAYSSWSEALSLCPIYGDSDVQETFTLNTGDMERFCIFSLVFSGDGREIVGAANDGYLYICDRECHQSPIKIKGHADDVNSVTFADDTSQILYSAGDDGLCKIWDRRTLNETDPCEVGVLAGHMDGITCVDSRGDGRYLITNSKDQSIKLWDIRALSNQEGRINTRLAVANQNWDYRWHTQVPKHLYTSSTLLKGDTSVMTYRGHTVVQTLIRCHFSPAITTGQRYIYTGCGSGRIIIYDLLTGEIVHTLEGHDGCVRDVSWHPYHQEITSASWDGVIGNWRYSKLFYDISLEVS